MSWVRRKSITDTDSLHKKDADHRTTHQWREHSHRTECQCRFSMYFQTRVTVSQKLSWLTHRNPQWEGEGEHRAENPGTYCGGGWSALKVAYDNEEQF